MPPVREPAHRNTGDLWIAVTLLALSIDLALSAVIITGRYQLGRYLGRAYGFMAGVFVLAVLLRQTVFLYSNAVESARRMQDSERGLKAMANLVPDLLWRNDA